jgi:hypothetical protein
LRKPPLIYDRLSSKVCCLDYRQDYYFTNETLVNFKKAVALLPRDKAMDERPYVMMGKSIERSDIEFVNFINIFDQASKKLNIDMSGVNLKKVLKDKDPNELIPLNPESILSSLIFKVIEWDCVELLNLLKRHNVKFD